MIILTVSGCGQLIPLLEESSAEEKAQAPTETPVYIETEQAKEPESREEEPEPEPVWADAVQYEPADYTEELIRRNTAVWAIQNAVCSEAGDYQTIGKKTILLLFDRIGSRVPTSRIPLILPWTLPEEEQPPMTEVLLTEEADAEQVPWREFLTEVYHRWLPETEKLLIPDETLVSFAEAKRFLLPEADKNAFLEDPVPAESASRALYFIDGGEYELENHLMRMPFFYQGIGFFDGLAWRHWNWGGVTFNINGHTMTEAGCGFFAAAMAMSHLKERVIEPVEFKENGEYTGNGAAHTVGEHSAQQYGIPAHRTADWEEAEAALREGFPVMVLEKGPSRWAQTGHFIILAGIAQDGTMGVYNPGNVPHMMYAVSDYGMYTKEDILENIDPDLPFTIFGK